MTTQQPPYSNAHSDADIDSLLRDALATQPLDGDRLQRLRAAVAQEWRAGITAAPQSGALRGRALRSRRVQRLVWAAAASVALGIGVAALLWTRSMPEPVAAGTIARLEEGSLQVRSGLFQRRRASVGDALRVGDRLTTHGPMLVALAAGGTLRIATGTTVTLAAPARFALETGLIYLDLPPAASTTRPLEVLTRAGTIQHVGTEFEVLSDPHRVRLRVREGRVRFTTASRTVEAGAGTELLAGAGGRIDQRPVATYGRDWAWETALAPEFALEGKSLGEFLIWVSRELGCRLDFADAKAGLIAERTILHGHVSGATPADVLANVLATTSLRSELHEDDLSIHSTP